MKKNLDMLSVREILQVIYYEDCRIAAAIKTCLPTIAKAVSLIVPALQKHGTLYYVGAGTSGRLGVLDASEIWPTFGSAQIKAIIAGGKKAITQPVENSEDNTLIVRTLIKKKAKKGDIVFGIAASGNTPFTVAALQEAKKQGCKTIGLVCTPRSQIKKVADVCIEALVGDEVICGSTRMKAGTATKMILNMISTTVMIQLGKVYGNLMVGVQPTNNKLKKRARYIFSTIVGKNNEKILKESKWNIPVAVVMAKKKLKIKEAIKILEEKRWNLRKTFF